MVPGLSLVFLYCGWYNTPYAYCTKTIWALVLIEQYVSHRQHASYWYKANVIFNPAA